MQRKSQLGFTLVELMVTIAVLAILAAIAVPNLRSFILSSSLSSATSELRSTLARARTEAANRSTIVTVATSSPTGTSVFGWSNGYQLFVNPLNASTCCSGTIGTGTDKKTAELLYQGELPEANVVGITSPDFVAVSYGPDGRTSSSASIPFNGDITLCVDPAVVPSNNARRLRIDRVGRVSVVRETRNPCPAAS